MKDFPKAQRIDWIQFVLRVCLHSGSASWILKFGLKAVYYPAWSVCSCGQNSLCSSCLCFILLFECSLAYFACLHLLPNYFLSDVLITVPYFSFSWLLKVFIIFNLFFWLAVLLPSLSLSRSLSLSLTHTCFISYFSYSSFSGHKDSGSFQILCGSQSACWVFSLGNWMTQLFTFSYTQKKSVWGARPLHCRAYLAMTHIMWERINREHLALLNFSFKDF